jgi:hypothetical protein
MGAGALALVLGEGASAADNYMQPLLELSGEYHTNRGLEPNDDQADDLMGYQLDAGLVFGMRTPTAETQIRPRVSFERYTQNSRLDNDEQALDIVSNWHSPRSEFTFIGKGSREDTFSTELIEPGFDPLDPTDPTILNPGRIAIDNVMTRGQLRGDFSHRVTERTGFGLAATAEAVRFEHEIPGDRIDYNYGRFNPRFERDMTERLTMSIGPYVSRYEAQDDSYLSDGVGVQLGFGWRLSQTYTVNLKLLGEQDSVDRIETVEVPIVIGDPPIVIGTQLVETEVHDESNHFGGTLGVQRQGPISRVRFELGHTVAPSVRGGNVEADQVHGEYERQISPRLGFNVAVRYLRDNKVRNTLLSTESGDRQWATGALSLQWQMTPRWYVNGGLEEIWQDFESDPSSASDHTAFIGFGYVGLGAQK